MKRLFAIFAQSNFWLWNLLFAYVVYLAILPLSGFWIIQAIAVGEIPIPFAISLGLLLVVPAVSIAMGIRYIRRPMQLLRIFYGVEVPLLVLVLVRLFALRELMPAGNFVLVSLLLSILTYGVELMGGFFKQRSLATVQTVLHCLMLLMGLYGGSVLLIYAVPAAIALTASFLTFEWVGWLWQAIVDSIRYSYGLWFLTWPLMLVLGWLSAGLFLLAPGSLAALYIQSGQRAARNFAQRWGKGQAIGLGTATLVAWLIAFGWLNQQPQLAAFNHLETVPQTEQAKQTLINKSGSLKAGLLNAYLSDYRYVSSIKDNNHVVAMYQSVLPGIDKAVPEAIQSVYNQLLSPFLYQNYFQDSDKTDSQEAAKRYAQFFDQPIQKSESGAIRKSLNATAFRDEAKAGLLNINQKKVLLEKQELTINEQGDWADVELYEVYKNQTNDVQEVYYSFSLPESAVLTGIWLGDTPDLNKRFEFQVSPRGAAQKVYNSQVQRTRPIDPALLEQVGPRHYRLRAFPIPPKVPQWAANGTRLEDQPTEMNLWLTYKVMRDDQGWAMPQLGEKRNIFWNRKTQYSLNGQVRRGTEDWLPSHVAATSSAKDPSTKVTNQPQSHQVDLEGYRVTAQPLNEKDYRLPEGKRFAIVLDSSRSMAEHKADLVQTFQWLKQQGFANNQFSDNDADLFITAMAGAEPQRLDDLRSFKPKRFTFYGAVQLQDMLTQFSQLQGDTAYDGVIVLTDGDTYELSKESGDLPQINAPLWMVHLGKLPPAYEDGVLKLMQDSDGGVGTELAEVLSRAATQESLQAQLKNPNVAIADGYIWSVTPQKDLEDLKKASKAPTLTQTKSPETASESNFHPLAARQLINQLAKATDANQPTELDRIHAIAKRYKLVTPYSSMIVLVNDEQRRLLAEAEAAEDRFDRDVESGDESLEKPFNPLNSASVPEASPLLPVVLAGGAFWLLRRRRSSPVR